MGWLTKLLEDYMLTKVLYALRQKTTELAGQTKEKTFYKAPFVSFHFEELESY
jgi:hypothetical protein